MDAGHSFTTTATLNVSLAVWPKKSIAADGSPVTVDAILDATAKQYGTLADQYCGYRSRASGRDVAAMLCRRWTTATLRELSGRFGLSHPDSASDLIKRGKRLAESNRDVAGKVASIERALRLNPESRV